MAQATIRGTGTVTEDSLRKQITSHTLFIAAILSLAISPELLFGSEIRVLGFGPTTLQNVLVIMLVAPYVLQHGLRNNAGNPVLLTFSILAVTSLTLATRHPSLSTKQTLLSLAAYMLGPALYEIKFTVRLRRLLHWTLPALAPLSVVIGSFFTVLGLGEFYRIDYTGVFRLQGASIPAHLAMMALVGLMVSALFTFHNRRLFGLFFVNFAIVVWTGTRGAIISAVIVVMAYLVSESLYSRTVDKPYQRSRAWLSVIVLVLIFVSYLPGLITRFSYENVYDTAVMSINNGTTATFGNSSGRLRAWLFFVDVALEDIAFGRGIGAGTVVGQGKLHPAFDRAPHNEYIRLLVDGGLLALILVLMAYALVFWYLQKHLALHLKLTAIASFAAFAFLASLDNVLSTQVFVVPFWLYLSLIRSELHTPLYISPSLTRKLG